MGSSKKQTVSYWYHPFFQLALHEGPFDKLLKIRGGDVDAWVGELTASGSITVDAPNLWGGEEKEGGIQGTFDVMFGEMDAEPNVFFQTAMGPDPSNHNGVALLQFNSGRYGAGNPYPKAISVLTERIYEGWLDDVCWYPETAEVPTVGTGTAPLPATLLVTGQPLVEGGPLCATANAVVAPEFVGVPTSTGADIGAVAAYADGYWVLAGDHVARVAQSVYEWTPIASALRCLGGLAGSSRGWILNGDQGPVLFDRVAVSAHPPAAFEVYRFTTDGAYFSAHGEEAYMVTSTESAFWMDVDYRGVLVRTEVLAGSPLPAVCHRPGNIDSFRDILEYDGALYATVSINLGARHQLRRSWDDGVTWPDILIDEEVGGLVPVQLVFTGTHLLCLAGLNQYVWSDVDGFAEARATGLLATTHADGRQIAATAGRAYIIGKTGPDNAFCGLVSTADGVTFGAMVPLPVASVRSIAASPAPPVFPTGYMNPAHVVWDSIVYLQGEPAASIDDASFRAAAARLYAEGFGICTKFNHAQETIEQFRQRILDLIGAECSRYNGRWYLDLIRELSPTEIAALPVLSDDDILDWQEDPTNRDDAVNQVAVKWFDPETKQSRITPHVHALAAINTLGSVNAEVREYPEVPYEPLANRLALRDLRNKSSPARRFNHTTTRKPYNWRKGRAFRLQSPKRGIADMVCRVADIDRGTLQSGAIRLVAVQDIFAMPATAYVTGQPSLPPPSPVPEPIAHQLLFEAPYVELAGVLSPADLAALDADAGFILAAGVKPGNGQGYALLTRPAGGDFERIGTFDWCPSAVVVEGSGFTDTGFTLAAGSLLARVELGTAALWGSEFVRVDALDMGTGAVEFGRACGDTVPARHDPGERIYFFDAWGVTDQVEYATAETVEAKLLPRTGTQELSEADVTGLDITMDQRAARPYPPAGVRLNGEAYPATVAGDVEITAYHRDRVAQADQLVDQTVGDIGPEPGTTYVVRNVDTVTESETYFASGITAFPHVVPADDLAVSNRLEVYSLRDGLESWQRVVVEFSTGSVLLMEDGSPILTEDGDSILLE